MCGYGPIVGMGHLPRLEITLGKWSMLGAYIRAPLHTPPGWCPHWSASETIPLFPPGELYSPRVILPCKLELFCASVLSSAPFLPYIFSVNLLTLSCYRT